MQGDLDIIFGANEVVPVAKTIQGTAIPELPMDGDWFALSKASGKKHPIETLLFAEAVCGDSNPDDPIHELARLAKVTNERQATIDILAKSGKAGKALAKEIQKSGGISDGMSAMYALFLDRFQTEERTLAEKAIRVLDVAAFHQILIDVFQRG